MAAKKSKKNKCDYAMQLVFAFNTGLIETMGQNFWDSKVRVNTFDIACNYLEKECKNNDIAEGYCGRQWGYRKRKKQK